MYQALHRCPSLLNGGFAKLDGAVCVVPAGGVCYFGGNVFECYGEVHDVQVEVVDAPVGQLLAADGLHLVAVVEGVPELGDEEEVFALDEAIFNGSGDTFASFFLVAVV